MLIFGNQFGDYTNWLEVSRNNLRLCPMSQFSQLPHISVPPLRCPLCSSSMDFDTYLWVAISIPLMTSSVGWYVLGTWKTLLWNSAVDSMLPYHRRFQTNRPAAALIYPKVLLVCLLNLVALGNPPQLVQRAISLSQDLSTFNIQKNFDK